MASRQSDDLPEVFELIRLRDACRAFMNKTKIGCSEDVYQSDWDIEQAYALFENIGDIIGYYGQED